jgi:hypothetical protein
MIQSRMSIPRLLANLDARRHPEIPGVEKPFAPSAEKAPRPCFLQVETQVAPQNKVALEKNGKELARLIGESGLPSRLAAWGAYPVEKGPATLYAYWDMPEGPATLLTAELRLPDVPEYAEFAKFILAEQKDIVIPMAGQRIKPQRALLGEYHYVRLEYLLDMTKLSEFSARLDGGLVPFAVKTKWTLGDTYLGLTGQEGTIVQIWRAPQGVSDTAAAKAAHDAAQQALEFAPWKSLAKTIDLKILEPASFDKQAPGDSSDSSWSDKPMNDFDIDAIGARGLVIYDNDAGGKPRYFYVQESELRRHPVENPSVRLQDLAKLRAPAIPLGKDQVLLNYDELKGLDESKLSSVKDVQPTAVPDASAVVVVEKGKFFVAPRAQWKEMVPGAEGDAGVLVSRGAVVAAIPENQIPSGTYCVLVNMEGLDF